MKLKGYTLLQSKLRTIRAALEAVEAEEEILDEFRDFIDNIRPEDFQG